MQALAAPDRDPSGRYRVRDESQSPRTNIIRLLCANHAMQVTYADRLSSQYGFQPINRYLERLRNSAQNTSRAREVWTCYADLRLLAMARVHSAHSSQQHSLPRLGYDGYPVDLSLPQFSLTMRLMWKRCCYPRPHRRILMKGVHFQT